MISVNLLTNIRACSNRALTYFDLRIGLMILILDHQTFQVRKNGGSVSYEAFWGMGISLPWAEPPYGILSDEDVPSISGIWKILGETMLQHLQPKQRLWPDLCAARHRNTNQGKILDGGRKAEKTCCLFQPSWGWMRLVFFLQKNWALRWVNKNYQLVITTNQRLWTKNIKWASL